MLALAEGVVIAAVAATFFSDLLSRIIRAWMQPRRRSDSNTQAAH